MRGLLLNSGGIDSPVAAYVMGKRDYQLKAVHFDNRPYTTDTTEIALKTLKKVSDVLGKDIPFFAAPHGEILSAFINICEKEDRKYTCIYCKRMMLRTAEKVARRENCDFLITGENLGQVASQTLQNIYVTSRAVMMPIVRPLIGLDKLDIIALAEKIGTYTISIEKAAFCSAVPRYPVVRAQMQKIESIEKRLNIEKLVSKAFENSEAE